MSYEPNSLGGGCPFQVGSAGFKSYGGPAERPADKIRGKAERFADHYTQATLFWNSQTEVEKKHIVSAFRFELSRVQTPAIRTRMVSGLMNVAPELGQSVAEGLGLPELPQAMPKVLTKNVKPEVAASSALSLFARPGDQDIAGRRIAILVGEGVNTSVLRALADRLTSAGGVPLFLSSRLGRVAGDDGKPIEIDGTLEAMPSVLFDGAVVPDGEAATHLALDGRSVEFLKDQYRHCKAILVLGQRGILLEKAGLPAALPNGKQDPGIIRADADGTSAIEGFISALAAHRHFVRETDPPLV